MADIKLVKFFDGSAWNTVCEKLVYAWSGSSWNQIKEGDEIHEGGVWYEISCIVPAYAHAGLPNLGLTQPDGSQGVTWRIDLLDEYGNTITAQSAVRVYYVIKAHYSSTSVETIENHYIDLLDGESTLSFDRTYIKKTYDYELSINITSVDNAYVNLPEENRVTVPKDDSDGSTGGGDGGSGLG
jgi:hypothetical protein